MKNKVELIGRVGQGVKTKKLTKDKTLSQFTLATSEYIKNKDGVINEVTQWHNCTAFGDVAEKVNEIVQKGKMIEVIGSIQYRSYEDQQGVKKYFTEIIVKSVNLND